MLRFLTLGVLVLAVGCGPIRGAEKAIALLGGGDLTPWELVAVPAAEGASAVKWQADGGLEVVGKPVSFLATKATYENYRLHLEWRWPAQAAKNSNSGVLLHVASGPMGGTAWPTCVQLQLKPTRAGDLLPMHGAHFAEKLSTAPDAKTPQLDRLAGDSEKPLGEWNTCDIVCRDGSIEVQVNGVLQNRITHCFPSRGRIGIQLEGTPFAVRNVLLTPLP